VQLRVSRFAVLSLVVVFALIGSTVTVLAKDMADFLKGQAN
jgi:hypothetical protein